MAGGDAGNSGGQAIWDRGGGYNDGDFYLAPTGREDE